MPESRSAAGRGGRAVPDDFSSQSGFAPYRGYSERQQPAGFGWSVPIGIGELFVYSSIEECVASLCRGLCFAKMNQALNPEGIVDP